MKAPSTQIDATIAVRLHNLINPIQKPSIVALKSILDDCAHYALASDFAMVAIDNAEEVKRLENGCLSA